MPMTTPAMPAISVRPTVIRAPSANCSAAGPIGAGAAESGTASPQRKTSRPIMAANIAQPGCCLVQFMRANRRQERQETSSLKYFSDSTL
jgi:hypothetical protein